MANATFIMLSILDLKWLVFLILVHTFIKAIGHYVDGLTLLPQSVDIWEDLDVTLDCSNNAQHFQEVRWYGNNDVGSMEFKDSKCKAFGLLTNQTLYMYQCKEGITYSVTIKKVSRTWHGDKWRCVNTGFSESNVVTINVKVPADTAQIIPNSTRFITENGTFSPLQCKSNLCRPRPIFLWYVDQNTDSRDDDQLLWEDIQQDDELMIYNSTLDYISNRILNGLYLFCAIGNKNNNTNDTVISDKLLLNITYPPDSPPRIIGLNNEDEYRVIEGSFVNLTCSVTGGNPLPQLEWSKSYNISQTITNSTVTSTIFWQASRDDQGSVTCSSIHLNKKTQSVNLTVLYSAKVINLFANTSWNEDNLTVSESDAFNLTCAIEGNPLPKGYVTFQGFSIKGLQNRLPKNFTSYTTIQSSNILYLITEVHAKCTDAGRYLCTGWNEFQNGAKTESNKSLTLFVKCKPRKSPYHKIHDDVQSVVSQDVKLSFTGFAYPVPSESEYVWLKKKGGDDWTKIDMHSSDMKTIIDTSGLQSNLTIKNVTQFDSGLYKVSVVNGSFEHTFNLTVNTFTLTSKDDNDTFHIGLAAGVVIGSAAFLIVSLVVVAVYKRRSSGVKRNITSTCCDAKDKHIYQNVNAEMTEYRKNASSEHNTTTVARNRLSGALSLRKSNATEATYVLQEFHHFANIQELGHHGNTQKLDHHGNIPEQDLKSNIQEKDHRGNILELDHIGDLQELGTHVNIHLLDHIGTTQALDLYHFDGLQELEIYEDPQELDGDESTHAEYGNTLEIVKKIELVYVPELFSYLTGTTKDYFEAQFTTLPKGLTKTYSFSQKPENISLNRYHGIYPYDHSRVKIPDIPDFFINACYIDGFESTKAYIACLGPMEKTTNNFVMFWQMVWSENSDVIVMLTLLVEHSGVKCDQYWPNHGTSISYGHFTVTSVDEDIYSDYVIRKFMITKDGEVRNITHFHFTAWPDKSVPEDVTCLLEFRRRVRKHHISGPLIVHCSAGIGRTGTLIAIDILIEEGRSQGSVNVLQCVKKMREQRVNMVQTLEQYYYIYKTLVNALVFDNDAIPKEDFCKYTDISKIYNFSAMFQTFNQSVESECSQESRARTMNTELRYGNRDGSDIPGDAHRVRLFLSSEMSSSDYINAVYVNSYTTANHFIVAQSPLPNGVEDFLCLIYQAECTCVVSMDADVGGKIAGLYLPPDNSNVTIGNFTVTSRRLDFKDSCIVRQVKISLNGMFKGAEKVVYHFQYTGWSDGHRVPSYPKKFVEFARNVENCFEQFGNENSHILVHCLNAFERSCLFCAVLALTETAKHEREVCIPNTLRRIRTRRRRAFPNMEQFRFCFQAVRAYTETDTEGDNTYMICY